MKFMNQNIKEPTIIENGLKFLVSVGVDIKACGLISENKGA